MTQEMKEIKNKEDDHTSPLYSLASSFFRNLIAVNAEAEEYKYSGEKYKYLDEEWPLRLKPSPERNASKLKLDCKPPAIPSMKRV